MAKTTKKRAAQKVILAIDVGGSRVKVMTSKERTRRAFESGAGLSAREMVREVKALTRDWSYQLVAIGYPGPVANNRPISRAAQSRPRLGRLQFRKGVRPADQGRQRRADAGDRQL